MRPVLNIEQHHVKKKKSPMLLISLKTVCDDSTHSPIGDIFNDAKKGFRDGHTKETGARHYGQTLGGSISKKELCQNKGPAKIETVEVDSLFLCILNKFLHAIGWPASALSPRKVQLFFSQTEVFYCNLNTM